MNGAISRTLLSSVFLMSATLSVNAVAAIVHLSGNTVDFFYDDSQPGMAAFGTLTAVGDSISATPTNFLATAQDGANDSFSVTGTVTVVAKPGYSFNLVQVAEQGDYTLAGSGASVAFSGTLDVSDSNNVSTTISTPLASASDFTLPGTNPWAGSASTDLSTAMWNGVTSIDLTLATLLNATTLASGELATIQNKLTAGGLVTIVTTPVPLPASIWLFGTGLALLLGKARRG